MNYDLFGNEADNDNIDALILKFASDVENE